MACLELAPSLITLPLRLPQPHPLLCRHITPKSKLNIPFSLEIRGGGGDERHLKPVIFSIFLKFRYVRVDLSPIHGSDDPPPSLRACRTLWTDPEEFRFCDIFFGFKISFA